MNYKIVKDGHIKMTDFLLFNLVLKIIEWSPDEWNAAELCTYIHQELPFLLHIIGTFAGLEHNWMLIKDTNLIIDVYPIGSATPVLLSINHEPWRTLYKEV